MILTAMTGRENWRGHSCKLHVFVSPTDGRSETHIGDAVRDPTYPDVNAHSSERLHARPGYRIECGEWTLGTYNLPQGTILKLFYNRSSGGFTIGTGGSMMANQFIQLREEAALRRLTVQLSHDPTARFSAAYIQGRFDLLSFEEATLRRAPTRLQFAKFSAPEVVSRAFSVHVVEPEVRPRPALTRVRTRTGTGKVVEVVSIAKRSRRML